MGDDEVVFGCSHFKRRCKLITPCCNAVHACRLCHDDKTDHKLDVKSVTHILCTECQATQPVGKTCIQCGTEFGKFFCGECRIFDDEDRGQYHCEKCGACVSGGRENNFHCDTCNLCLPIKLQENHKCMEDISRRDCPVCKEYMHTGGITLMLLRCGHIIHFPCLQQLVSMGQYTCPVCLQSLAGMTDAWPMMDAELAAMPMGPEFANTTVGILCRDCHEQTTANYHDLGFKCKNCGSYNTVKISGPYNFPGSEPVSTTSQNQQ